MELKFDSIKELEEFLMFAAHVGSAFAPAPQIATGVRLDELAATPAVPTVDTEMTPEQSAAHYEAQTTTNEAYVAATVSANAEVAKRKRRTKAEMEAARAAETGVEGGGLLPKTAEDTPEGNPAGANPFAVASPATQAILEAPNQTAATLAGMVAMQNPPAEEIAASRAIESIDHLRACQAFIQAHGMTKYNESFRDGLMANIAIYSPEQRAQHVAILETLAG